jgi:hypothetical protein
MVAGRRNQSFFSFNHFRKPCNHPNLYRSGYSRTSRLKTLPRSHDGTGMSIVSGLRLIRPESMPSAEITSYNATMQELFPTTPFRPNLRVADLRTQGCKLSDVNPRGTKLYINSERIVAGDY